MEKFNNISSFRETENSSQRKKFSEPKPNIKPNEPDPPTPEKPEEDDPSKKRKKNPYEITF